MNRIQTERERLLTVLMQAYSLSELLDIMKSICINISPSTVNTRSKHFAHFKLTFFGLTVKANGLIEKMEMNLDVLQKTVPECENIYSELKKIKEEIDFAHNFIKMNKINEGKENIIRVANEYSMLFEQIMKLKENFWQ
jgi:hypothetical protein